MKAVIQSDLYCAKWYLLFYAGFAMLFCALCCVGLPPHLTAFAFVLLNVIIFKQIVECESFGWERYLVFSGVKRQKMVSARFLESAAINLVTAAAYALAMAINTLFIKEDNILSAAEIFMYISLDILICAAMSVLLGIYYVSGDNKLRGTAEVVIIFAMLLMVCSATTTNAVSTFLNELAKRHGALFGAVFSVLAAAVYVAFYAASLASFKKKEI